jgi:hypothetical protein
MATEQEVKKLNEELKNDAAAVFGIYDDFRKQLSEQFANMIAPAICKMCDTYGVDGITVGGYTPSWNDGDVCEHSMYEFEVEHDIDEFDDVDVDALTLKKIHEYDMCGFQDVSFENDEIARKAGISLIKSYINGWDYLSSDFFNTLSAMFELVYETNFCIYFEMQEDRSVVAHVGTFYPEY